MSPPGQGPLVLLLLLAPTAAAQEAITAPVPAWVEVVPVELSVGDATEGSVDFLLYDSQDNVSVTPLESYTRMVKAVHNEQGVQHESQVSVDFDPAYQVVAFHEVVLHRGGRRLDRLDAAAIRVIQREQQLEQQIYDGKRTALLFLADVRVGDVIEYSFTVRGRSPVFGERYFESFLAGYAVPVGRIRKRILVPEGCELAVRNFGVEVEPTTRPIEGGRELLWDLRDVPARLVDDWTPSWYDSMDWVQVSQYANWAEVAAWGEQLFRVEEGPGEELRELARGVREGSEDPHERVRLALRAVQREVRYLGIMLNEGTHRPSPPNEVLARRFGDCKDKALLLTALLAELDIPARPALVNTAALHAVAEQLPTPGAFDHVIVRALIGEDELWLDPTMSSERGPLNEHALPDYDVALLLEPGAMGLVPVKRDQGVPAHTQIENTFHVKVQGPSQLSIVTTYAGSDANNVRQSLESVTTEQLSTHCLNYLATDYPQIAESRPPVVVDDQDANRLVVREEYSIPDIWEHGHDGEEGDWARFNASEIGGELARPERTRRTAPFVIPHPRDVTWRMVAHLPGDWEIAPERTAIANGAFRFDRRLTYGSRRLTLELTYCSRRDHIGADELPGYLADLDRAEAVLGYEISDPRTPLTAAAASFDDMALGLGVTLVGVFVATGLAVLAFLRGVRPAHAPSLSAGFATPTADAQVPSAPPVRRKGRSVVLALGADFPARCIHCNGPAEVRRTRKVSWHSPWLYLLVPLGLLFYAIVAMVVMKRTSLQVGYCRRHHLRRVLAGWTNAAAILAGIATWIVAGPDNSMLFALGLLAVLYGLFNAIRMSNSVRAIRMDDSVVELRGMGRPFLESL